MRNVCSKLWLTIWCLCIESGFPPWFCFKFVLETFLAWPLTVVDDGGGDGQEKSGDFVKQDQACRLIIKRPRFLFCETDSLIVLGFDWQFDGVTLVLDLTDKVMKNNYSWAWLTRWWGLFYSTVWLTRWWSFIRVKMCFLLRARHQDHHWTCS